MAAVFPLESQRQRDRYAGWGWYEAAEIPAVSQRLLRTGFRDPFRDDSLAHCADAGEELSAGWFTTFSAAGGRSLDADPRGVFTGHLHPASGTCGGYVHGTVHLWYGLDLGWIWPERQREALAEMKRAEELDLFSPMPTNSEGDIYISARTFDQAIALLGRVANENPTFARVRRSLTYAYWGKRDYPRVIEEFRAYGQLADDRNESDFAAAMGQGFRSAGWRSALSKAIETRLAQRHTGYSSAYEIARLYADQGDKEQAFQWLNTAFRSAI
jgi:tetratricopeptide (TPR) repeat protein